MVSSTIYESETSLISANSAGCIPNTMIFRVRLSYIPIKLSERSLHSAALGKIKTNEMKSLSFGRIGWNRQAGYMNIIIWDYTNNNIQLYEILH